MAVRGRLTAILTASGISCRLHPDLEGTVPEPSSYEDLLVFWPLLGLQHTGRAYCRGMDVLQPAPTRPGTADLFTGTVWIDEITSREVPSHLRVNAVRFAPGARTAWHAHALGQTLRITDGIGRVQASDESVLIVRSGDTIWTPAGQWHWHGAAPDSFMSHLAIWETPEEGEESEWGAHVTDAEYLADQPRSS